MHWLFMVNMAALKSGTVQVSGTRVSAIGAMLAYAHCSGTRALGGKAQLCAAKGNVCFSANVRAMEPRSNKFDPKIGHAEMTTIISHPVLARTLFWTEDY